ncbi:MAG: DUF3905 domain-containing protein [Bacillaceae bacterium]|nr:DUF3905 domain-containing protein [Bacillaceae bacterium]
MNQNKPQYNEPVTDPRQIGQTDPASDRDDETRQHTTETEDYHTDFLPGYEDEGRPRDPFVNEFGVVIGDGKYRSPQSPLENWSKEVDPAVMAGDRWVHPYNDIGFNTDENRDYFEKGVPPQGYPFMHPTKDVSYGRD